MTYLGSIVALGLCYWAYRIMTRPHEDYISRATFDRVRMIPFEWSPESLTGDKPESLTGDKPEKRTEGRSSYTRVA
jgi:hypothetical protein